MIDAIANLLRIPGDALRELMLLIPLPVVKAIFILYPLVILLWVFTMKTSDVKGTVQGTHRTIDLRPFAAIAMIGQAIIYYIF